MEIAQTHSPTHLVVPEQVGKILLCELADMEQAVALGLALLFLVAKFLFLYLLLHILF